MNMITRLFSISFCSRTIRFGSLVAASLLAGLAFAATTVQVGISSSVSGNGVVVSVDKHIVNSVNNTNINLVPFTCGTIDSSISITPITSNALVTIINTALTNTPNFIKFGNATSNYCFQVRPQEAAAGRLLPGGDGLVHVACSNGTQTGLILISPNP